MTDPPIRWLDGFSAAAASLPAVWIGRLEGQPPPDPTRDDLREAATRPQDSRAGFLARRGLLRTVLARQLGIDPHQITVAADRNGAPRLVQPGANLCISSASRDGWIAVAIANSPVGVDLEVLGPKAEPAWNVLSREERAWLGARPSPDRWPAFLALWSGKEAYLKALRLGLRREPAEITIRMESGGALSIRDRDRAVPLAAAEHRRVAVDQTVLSVGCVALRADPVQSRRARRSPETTVFSKEDPDD